MGFLAFLTTFVTFLTTEVNLYLKDIITADMLSGVFNELVGVLPVVIPFSVGCMGVRKGLKFLFSCLRSA